MQVFSGSFRELILSLFRNRALVYTLVKRDVLSRYRGSFFGIFWSFFQPVFMLGIYTFVFSIVFKARWNAGSDSKTEFALVLFAGLIVFNLFSECINRAPSIILANTNYVKKVVFPLEILPWVALGASLFQACVSLLVWFLFYLVFFGVPHATFMMFPVVIIPLLFITIGLSWVLASLGVYLRDVGQLVGILTTVLLFLSPIFYPISSLAAEYRYLLQFNPLTPVIEAMRDVLYWGSMPSLWGYGLYWMVSVLFCWLGFAWFQKTRKGFADVL